MKTLIIDDDPKFRGFVRRGLEETGIICSDASSADQADEILREDADSAFDIILLDVLMPARTGWEFLEQIRAEGRDTPVIFLSGRAEVEERVKGLDLGADDYLVKPFKLTELLARINAVLRRRQALPTIDLGDLHIDIARRIVQRGGKRIEASPREFDFLRLLSQRPGETVTRAELLEQVWNLEFNPGTNVIEVLVARLRRKLDPTGRGLIETVVGKGYRLVPTTASERE